MTKNYFRPVSALNLSMKDFHYDLPEDRIAKFPMEKRDKSKLLLYRKTEISETQYKDIVDFLPADACLIFNNTKVVQARLHFITDTGALVEVFCLEPATQTMDLTLAMQKQGGIEWTCLVGRAAKWKQTKLITEVDGITLSAEKVRQTHDGFVIRFAWTPEYISFADVLERAGKMPIPPYLKRESRDEDADRYQTVYAEHKGSVAAPTAGLHFTDALLEQLRKANVGMLNVTLHVGAGTFKPVKTETIAEHDMHAELFSLSSETLEELLNWLSSKENIIAVGTTSLRTLESLYWLGCKVSVHPEIKQDDLFVSQWMPYENTAEVSAQDSLASLLKWMQVNTKGMLFARTQLLIAPGYKFRIIKGLVTNFHQPGSTLLLLVAALVGKDWRRIYDYALSNEFRFLSYGDGSLLLP